MSGSYRDDGTRSFMSSHFDIPKRVAWAYLRRKDYSRASGLIRAVFTLVVLISLAHKACADQPDGVQRKEAGPPIIVLPLDVVEPPRNVPAIEWNSPYCGHWDDGCVACRRQTVLAPLKCDEEAPVRGNACRRHAIACYEIIDESVFAQVCKRFLSEGFIEGDKSPLPRGFPKEFQWSYSNNSWTSNAELLPLWIPRGVARVLPPALGNQQDSDVWDALGYNYIPTRIIVGPSIRCFSTY